MATSVKDIKDTYPIPVFYYRVTINGDDSHAFSEVSGLSIEYEIITYLDGMSYKNGSKKMPGMGKPVTLTLKKGIVRKDSYLFEWISTISLNTVEKRDIRVDLLDETGEAVVSWTFSNAFPIKLDASTLSASANEVAIETLELAGNGLSIQYQ